MVRIGLQDAERALSALIDGARRGEPAIITHHGEPAAVVISFEEWERLSHRLSFGQLLMAAPLEDSDLAPRTGGLRPADL